MSQRRDQDWNWILTSKGRSSSPHQRQDSRSRSSDVRHPQEHLQRQRSSEERLPYVSQESKERVYQPRERRYDDSVNVPAYVQHSTREKSRDLPYDHRRSESYQNVPQSHQHQSRSRSRSDFERNQMLQETQDYVAPKKVFGPQLRDIEDDDDYYSIIRKSKGSRSYQSSSSPDQSPQRKPDLPKKKTLPKPPLQTPSRPRHRSVDSLGQLPSYSKDNYGQRDPPKDKDKTKHAPMKYLDPKNTRYHSRVDQVQKVVDELHSKGIAGQDSRQISRKSDQYGGQSNDTPIYVNETSHLGKLAPFRSTHSRQEYIPEKTNRHDSRDYSYPYRDYETNKNLSKKLRGQGSTDDEDDDMEEWRRQIQSPDRGRGFTRPSRSRDHTPVRYSEAQRLETSQSKDPQRSSEASRSRDTERKLEGSRSRDHTPQRKSRETERKSDAPRSRDHTPQRQSESPQSSPEPMFLSRSIEDLRTKHIYISLSQDKSKHLKRYLLDVESRSRESLNSLSGEKKNVRPGAPSEPNEYNFNYKRRGLFIIINNKNFHPETGQQTREGTDVDAERLEERFQDLGFEVKRYDDVTRSKMSTLMYDAAAYDHSDADCFGCAILSHGVEGRVYGIDGYVTLEVLVMPFKGDKCPSLVGKPKLFFLQACRGTKMDYGVNVSDSSLSSRDEDEVDASSTVSIRKIPIEADFLFAYSTVPGYYSWRNNQDGSWFIQALGIVMENYGMKMELLHMLTHVNRIVAYEFASCTDREFTDKMKQMPCVVSMLTRYVYFRHKKQDIR